MKAASFTATVKDGRIHAADPRFARQAVTYFEGEQVEVVVRKWKAKRSHQANARYWALLTVAARELGNETPKELHEGVAYHLLQLPNDERTGFRRRHRTPKLNTAEFASYMDAVERFFLVELHLDLSDWQHEIERIERAS